jgi:hydrogenase nickel incorporation protein HypB
MCATCGCSSDEVRVELGDRHGHVREAGHRHGEPHEHGPAAPTTLDIETRVLAKNDELAEHNRGWLAERGVAAVNLMSSPGAGKTSLLERTLTDARAGRAISVIEGDQETAVDAQRIRDAGAKAIQINTGSGCHLDATMVQRGLLALEPDRDSVVFIENVGNLVCPALFDLGERAKVVIISVTEGDDKLLKYPHMFAAADLVVVNKTDLLPYVDFDVRRCVRDARRLNPTVQILPLSVRDGSGLDAWYDWLRTL